MDDLEVKKRMQILRIAEAILIEDANTKYTGEYEQWSKTNECSSSEQSVAAPTRPTAPTQGEIVAKALEFFYACEELSSAATPAVPPPATAEQHIHALPHHKQPIGTYDDVLDPVRKIFGSSSTVLPAVDVAATLAGRSLYDVNTKGVHCVQ